MRPERFTDWCSEDGGGGGGDVVSKCDAKHCHLDVYENVLFFCIA